jgi:hypothetical protein
MVPGLTVARWASARLIALTGTLDLTRPVAVSLIAIVQFVVDEDEVYRIIDALMAPLPAGSALAISTVTAHNRQAVSAAREYTARGIPAKARTDDQVRAGVGLG